MRISAKTLSLLGLAVAFAAASVGCAPEGEVADEAVTTQAQALAACTPGIVVVRHAEDVDAERGETCEIGEATLSIPGGSQKVHQRCLTPTGKAHAALYAENLATWMDEKGLCPVGRVVTQDPWGEGGKWPSANPFETIRPFANATKAPITFLPSRRVFDASLRRSLLADAAHSVVVAWDKEGLWEGSAPLLGQMTSASASFPTRDMLYVFTNMNAETAKLDLAEYTQFFKDSSGYFAKVAGKAFSADRYYRFEDGSLASRTRYSTDLVPSSMTIGSEDCDDTVTLAASQRK